MCGAQTHDTGRAVEHNKQLHVDGGEAPNELLHLEENGFVVAREAFAVRGAHAQDVRQLLARGPHTGG